MDWLDDVKGRIKRKNQILFTKNSEYLADLAELIQVLNHRAVVLWALELADEAAALLAERYPAEHRPAHAVHTARRWAAGEVKMREAQRAILDAHAFAKNITSPEDIALCHAVGQACGTVHTPGHGVGFPMYELTATVHRHGTEHCREHVERRMQHYFERLSYWRESYLDYPISWAEFLLRS